MIQHILPVQDKINIGESVLMFNQWIGWVDTNRSENVKVRLEITANIKVILSQYLISKRCSYRIQEYSEYCRRFSVIVLNIPILLQLRPHHQGCQFVSNKESIFIKRGIPLVRIWYAPQGDIGSFIISTWHSVSKCSRQVWVIEPVDFGIKRLYFITIKLCERLGYLKQRIEKLQ